jgi:hypothetical protein
VGVSEIRKDMVSLMQTFFQRTEEPDALIGHVRVCGGSGEVTPRFYPAFLRKSRRLQYCSMV